MIERTWTTIRIRQNRLKEIESLLERATEFRNPTHFVESAIDKLLRNIRIEHRSNEISNSSKIIFSEMMLSKIHDEISKKSRIDDPGYDRNKIKLLIKNLSSESVFSFLADYIFKFAKIHPFNDGNKRTSWLSLILLLRINNLDLALDFKEDKLTLDEKFIWDNAMGKRSKEEIGSFIKERLIEKENKKRFEELLDKTIEEKKMMLENLSR